MKGITWARDSHGLFDYESRHLSKNTMKTNFPSTLRRVNNDIDLQPLGHSPAFQFPTGEGEAVPEVKQLLNIVNENGKARSNHRVDQFYIESVVGLGVTTIHADGTASPTSHKAMALIEKGNIADMSKALNEHMYLVVRR